MRGAGLSHLDTGGVLGTDFAQTMRAAQAGEEDAFVRLWRDANPAMIRYLRVVGHDDPYDEACEGWMTVVRGLPGFSGDETDWRVWVLACARQRAEESTLRRSWGSVTGFEELQVEGDGDIDLDEILETPDVVDPARRGLTDTLTALRALPLGQGEIVVLRLGAELPPGAVANLAGVDEDSVERAEARGLERLGADAELVSWSLAAPPSRAELADERIAVGAFNTVLARTRAERVKIIALGPGSARADARRVSSGVVVSGPGSTSTSATRRSSRSASRSDSKGASRSERGRSSADSRDSRRPGARGAKAAGRSRTAALAVSALSLSVVSLGGLGAAAYVGVLPAPVQQAMHDAVGAPAPTKGGAGSSAGRTPVTSPTAAVGPSATSSAAAGLCRAWSADKAKGTASERSVAFRNLATAAGGAGKVQAYCATALAQKPSRGAPTSSVTGTPPGKGKGTGTGTGKPTTKPGSTPRATGHTAKGTPANPTKPATTNTAKDTPGASQATTPGERSSTPAAAPGAQPTTARGKQTGRP